MSFALLFGALEVGIRLVGVRPHTVRIENLNTEIVSNREIHIANDSTRPMLVDTPTGIRLMRSSRAIISNHPISHLDVEVATNSLGFRHAELGPKTDAEFRILALGDSILFTSYLPVEKAFPAVIQSSLDRRSPPALEGMRLEVVNAAIGGIDLQNELAILMESGLSIDPDVVLLGLYLNDANESTYLRVTRLSEPFRHSRFLAYLVDRFWRLRARFVEERLGGGMPGLEHERELFRRTHRVTDERWEETEGGFNRRIDRSFHDWGFAWSTAYWPKVGELLGIMKRVSRDLDFKLAVVFFPVRYQVQAEILRDEPQHRFAELMAELDLPHLDLLPGLRSRYREDGIDLFYDYCHYRAEGVEFVSDRIAQFLLNEVL